MNIYLKAKYINGIQSIRNLIQITAVLLAGLGFCGVLAAEENDLSLEIGSEQKVVALERESASFTPEESLEHRTAISGSELNGSLNKLNRLADNAQVIPAQGVQGTIVGNTQVIGGTQFNQTVSGNTVGLR